jgi:DNA-binding LacI/PurR family transcriptional regulator
MTRPAKRITGEDVARVAGVSRTTVSFVLNNRPGQSIPDETRQRVLEAAKLLKYKPHASARSLAAGRSDIVLLAVPDLPIGAGMSRFVEELAAALAEHDLTLVTHLEGAHGRSAVDTCARIGASAVIGFESLEPAVVEALHQAGAEVVLPLRSDDSGATEPVGRAQAEHLISRGHRRLGYAMPAHPGLAAMAAERLRGATLACKDAGLEPPLALTTSLEISAAVTATTRWSEAAVTGVCAFNDETAIAVLAGLRERGLSAPADMAVVGADDIPTARLAAPPLTTVSFDLRGAGRRRAEAVVASLTGQDVPPSPVEGVVRVVQRASS